MLDDHLSVHCLLSCRWRHDNRKLCRDILTDLTDLCIADLRVGNFIVGAMNSLISCQSLLHNLTLLYMSSTMRTVKRLALLFEMLNHIIVAIFMELVALVACELNDSIILTHCFVAKCTLSNLTRSYLFNESFWSAKSPTCLPRNEWRLKGHLSNFTVILSLALPPPAIQPESPRFLSHKRECSIVFDFLTANWVILKVLVLVKHTIDIVIRYYP